MSDRYPVRPLRDDDEFEAWARMTSDTYGLDWHEGGLRNARGSVDLRRTLAAFDAGAENPVVGGAVVYSRALTVPGAVQQVAGVAMVAVAPTHRRRGLLTALMRRQLTDVYESGGEPIAALNASEAVIYGRFGYGPATRIARFEGDKRRMRFRDDVETGDGVVRRLERETARPLIEKTYDAARTRSVGWLERTPRYWEARLLETDHVRAGATRLRFAVHEEPGGEVTGYALYRLRAGDATPERPGTVQVVEVAATTRQAYAALWRYLAGIDVHFRLTYEGAPDEALPHLLTDARAVRAVETDNVWVRPVDLGRALAGRRYSAPLDVVLEVEDAFCPWNAGRHRLTADGEEVTCTRTRDAADLRLTAAELGAAHLGGTTLASLAAAGRVTELRPGALARASTAFRGVREPFHPAGAAFPAC
jgi:predicted acetyltransferase